MVSRAATAGATSSGSTLGVVKEDAPLIRDRGRAARDDWSPDGSRRARHDLLDDAEAHQRLEQEPGAEHDAEADHQRPVVAGQEIRDTVERGHGAAGRRIRDRHQGEVDGLREDDEQEEQAEGARAAEVGLRDDRQRTEGERPQLRARRDDARPEPERLASAWRSTSWPSTAGAARRRPARRSACAPRSRGTARRSRAGASRRWRPAGRVPRRRPRRCRARARTRRPDRAGRPSCRRPTRRPRSGRRSSAAAGPSP